MAKKIPIWQKKSQYGKKKIPYREKISIIAKKNSYGEKISMEIFSQYVINSIENIQ